MRSLHRAVRGVFLLVAALLLTSAAATAAGVVSVPDTVIYNYRWEYGSVPRTITTSAPGWPVAFEKTDGPRMYMGAVNCSTLAHYDYNVLQDEDPPVEYEEVATISIGTTFCTSWLGLGSNSVDTFRGTLAWD